MCPISSLPLWKPILQLESDEDEEDERLHSQIDRKAQSDEVHEINHVDILPE